MYVNILQENIPGVSVDSNNHQDVEPDIFGLYDSGKMIDRGWLTTETVVQFKLFENPIQLWKRKYEGRKVKYTQFEGIVLDWHINNMGD